MQVGQLHDTESFEVPREVHDWHFHLHHRRPARPPGADHDNAEGGSQHGFTDDSRIDPGGEVHQVGHRHEDDEQGRETHRAEPRPLQRGLERNPLPPAGEERREREENKRRDSDPLGEASHAGRRGREQAHAEVEVEQRPQPRNDQDTRGDLAAGHARISGRRGRVKRSPDHSATPPLHRANPPPPAPARAPPAPP